MNRTRTSLHFYITGRLYTTPSPIFRAFKNRRLVISGIFRERHAEGAELEHTQTHLCKTTFVVRLYIIPFLKSWGGFYRNEKINL